VRALTAGVCLALVPVAAVALTASPAAAAPCGSEAESESAARALAVQCARRVEVVAKRSERGQVFANPEGSLTAVMSPVARRVQRGKVWLDIDPTLVRAADGTVAPRAAVGDLTLSGGGSGPLLTFGVPGKRFSLKWSGGALPTPVLDNNRATYPEVLPGVDLRVEAGRDSFRKLLVVKTREAATNPALRQISFALVRDGLTLRSQTDGTVRAVDGSGEVVFESPGAFMWDSPVLPASGAAERAAQHGEPTPHRIERVPVRVDGSTLVVTPSAAMLTAADTVFPVMIDPAFSKPTPMWYTNVMDDNPNHSYYGEYSEMRVGRAWETSNRWRAHMQFDTVELKGSDILTAELSVTADHTAACGNTSIQLWQTQYVASPGSYTWYNDSDGDWAALIDTKSFSANEASCPKGDDENTFTGSLKSKLQALTNTNRFPVGLRAANESDHYQWTRFHGDETFLTVTFNRKPNVPTDMAITDCYLNCSSNPVVSRKDPELSVFATDPDPSTVLTVYFEVQTSAGAAVVTGVKTGYASGPSKPAQPAKWRITPLLGDGNYRWRARSKDGQNAYSGYTAWFAFSTDSTAPDVPDVGPDDPDVYFEDDGSGVCSGGIGIGGDFDLSGGSSVVHFTWSLDGGAYSSPVPTAGTNPKTATISVRPLKDMVRSLKVRAYDAAGRFGEASYAFRVCSPPPEAGHWKLDGTGNDDVELITVPHHAYDDFVAWPQDRWGPQPRPSEYTVSSGPQAFVPADQTVLALTGDDETLAITLPFPMPFYGQSYTQAWVDTNGLVSLAEHTDSEYWNTPIPSPYPPSLALYPFWDDLVVETDSSVRVATTGTAPNRVFVIEWRNVAFYAESAKRVTFEVQLSETGTITFAYTGLAAGDAREAGGWATVGIENGVGGTAAVHGYNQPLLVSGGGVQFTPTGYEAPPYPDGYHEAQFYGTGAINTPGPVLATGLRRVDQGDRHDHVPDRRVAAGDRQEPARARLPGGQREQLLLLDVRERLPVGGRDPRVRHESGGRGRVGPPGRRL
jgi:hypothetical protein